MEAITVINYKLEFRESKFGIYETESFIYKGFLITKEKTQINGNFSQIIYHSKIEDVKNIKYSKKFLDEDLLFYIENFENYDENIRIIEKFRDEDFEDCYLDFSINKKMANCYKFKMLAWKTGKIS